MSNEIKIGKNGSTAMRVFDALKKEINDRTVAATPKSGEVAPDMNAAYVGQFYVDTELKKAYIAVATDSDPATGDWKEVTNA